MQLPPTVPDFLVNKGNANTGCKEQKEFSFSRSLDTMAAAEEGTRAPSPPKDLEELLTYDDLFLEYFNAFLASPAFPMRLRYDRLRGQLRELGGSPQGLPGLARASPCSPGYGATDEERERSLGWLIRERAQLFPRTALYLEYKLAKLLIRPLDEGPAGSQHSVCGCSRQSDGTAASSLPSRPSAARWPTGVPSREMLRPLRRIQSTPAHLGCLSDIPDSFPRPPDSSEVLADLDLGQASSAAWPSRLHSWAFLSSCSAGWPHGLGVIPDVPSVMATGGPWIRWIRAGKTVGLSGAAPCAGRTASCAGRCDRELSSGARTGLQLDMAEASDSEGEGESWLLGDLTTSALQRLKEDVLGTRAGMDAFQQFLHGTLGLRLLHLWLDCEDFKESTQCLEANIPEEEAQLFRMDLLRYIQQKYMLNLFPISLPYQRQSRAAATFAILSRTQYDALRRLRSYWVPRFLIHCWRAACLRLASQPDDKPKTSLPTVFLPSLQIFELLPPVEDQCGDGVDRSMDCLCVLRSANSRRGSVEPGWQPSFPWHIPKTPQTSRILQALQGDLRDGGGFLYYLTRYADAQAVQSLLLWQELEQQRLAWEQQADETQWHRAAWHIFLTYLVPGAPCRAGLGSDMLPCIRHLQEMLSSRCGQLGPVLFEPVAQRVFATLQAAWLQYCRYEITTFLECCVPISHSEAQATKSKAHRAKKEKRHKLRKSKGNTEYHVQESQQHQRRRKKLGSKLESSPSTAMARGGEDAVPWQQTAALLTNKVVFKVYRKAVEEMQLSCVQRVLGLLQMLQSCLTALEDGKRLSCAQALLGLWKQQGKGPDSLQLPVELKKRLKAEITQGAVSNSSLEEIQAALFSCIAPAFEQFWAEMGKGLSRHGVQPSQTQGDGWSSLEPLLYALSSKVAFKHLKKREAAVAQPSPDDKDTLKHSLQDAAKGWPTLEMFHFLNHLQMHGPAMLEDGLRFQLEVQKFKNAHHTGSNRAFLRRKVRVIRDCFLLPQMESKLQVAVGAEKLERAVRATEHSLLEDESLPPPGLFDELWDSVLSSLLPYWAAFQKAWLQRSPESAHRVPVLRVQKLLQQRRDSFERPPKLLPPVQLPQVKQPLAVQSNTVGLTYTFSISKGITVKVPSRDVTSTSVSRNGKRLLTPRLPPLPTVPVLF